MTTEQKKIWTNSATLRPKTGERRSEKAPTWGGDGEVDCPHCNRRVAFWLDAWEKTKEGVAFFSIALKRKDKQPDATESQAAPSHQTSMGFSGPGARPEPSRKPQSGHQPSRGFDDDGEIPFGFALVLASSLAFAALTAGAPFA